jgi:hypothetical protein
MNIAMQTKTKMLTGQFRHWIERQNGPMKLDRRTLGRHCANLWNSVSPPGWSSLMPSSGRRTNALTNDTAAPSFHEEDA